MLLQPVLLCTQLSQPMMSVPLSGLAKRLVAVCKQDCVSVEYPATCFTPAHLSDTQNTMGMSQ